MNGFFTRAKRVLFSFVAFICSTSAFSQVSISPTNTLSFYFKPSDVLFLSVISSQQEPIDVYLTGRIKNVKSNVEIKIRSSQFSLKPGINNFTPATLQVNYEISSYAREMNINSSSVLPIGRYIIEISIVEPRGIEQIATYDYEQEITPLSPPFLISPPNNAELDILYPLLIWSPALPVSSKYKMEYDLKVVEVLMNQTPGDAIQKNFAVYEQKGIKSTTLQYPANAVKLEYNKQYAWQVAAKTSDYFIGETEVFAFTPVLKNEKKMITSGIYGVLSRSLDAGYYTAVDKKVYFAYQEEYQSDILNFKILNDMAEDIRLGCSLTVKKEPGDNHFMLDLSYCSGVSKGFYTLEVWNEKNELYKLKFKVD
jgi:hypothetical protein